MSDINCLLKIKGVSRKYSKKARGVSDLSFDIKPGERVALLGLNGAGKSTTFKLITGLLSPEKGSIEFDGQDMSKYTQVARKKMGYLSEDIPLCRELSVREHLKFQASHFMADPHQLTPLIELCELKEVLNRPIGHLSRGFRQRVALAGTLVHQPKFLLLDEPTAGLDPHQVDQFRQLIKTVAKDCSLLLSTHILSEVEVMCNRCLILHEGRLLADVNLPFQSEKTWELCCQIEGQQPDKCWKLQGENKILGGKLYQKTFESHVSPADELGKIIHQKVNVLSYTPKYETLESLFLKITSGDVG